MKTLMLHGSDAGLRQVRLDGLEVHEDLALVVGGATRVDLAVPDGCLEWRRHPFVDRIDRLHVVVAVEEDRRLPGAPSQSAYTTGFPGVSISRTFCIPIRVSSPAVHSAQRRTSAACAGSALTLGMAR